MLAAAGTTSANEREVVNGDGSVVSEVCVAAITQSGRLEHLLDVHRLDRSLIRCNGMEIDSFVDSVTTTKAPAVALLSGEDSPATEICIAAATSDEQYQALKQQYFNGNRGTVSDVVCNGLPIADFAREFGNDDFRI